MIIAANGSTSLQNELNTVHANLKQELAGISRVAVAIYDSRTDLLKTFVHSTEGESPFQHYEAKLSDVPSLAELARSHTERIIQDLQAVDWWTGPHHRQLLETGFRSSYTKPFYDQGELFGFVFFDSDQPNYFSPPVVRHLTLYAHLISLLIIKALTPANVLRSAVIMARDLSHLRDEETGAHLDRMARYARMIAKALVDREGLNDEFVEFVFLFAPLHDVGKIGIPDNILLKPGKLSVDEFEVMKTHVDKGVAIIDKIAHSFGIGSGQHIDVLRNIVQFHHEAFDGSGYQQGLTGKRIPLEARIVTVADVFDALTSNRPYKSAWSNTDAFQLLQTLADKRFDRDCVEALASNRRSVEALQERFRATKGEFEGFHEAYMEGL